MGKPTERPESIADKQNQSILGDQDNLPPSDQKKDYPKIALLVLILLYMTHGFGMGYADSLMSILRGKGVSSDEIGKLGLVNFPSMISFVVGPVVDRYFFSGFGKRRTYIFPCKMAVAVCMFMLSRNIEGYVEDKDINMILTWMLSISIFQVLDLIALLGYNVEIFGTENAAVSSFVLFNGIVLGQFIGGAFFNLMNSEYFCQEILGYTSGKQLINHTQIITFFACLCLVAGLLTFCIKEEVPKQQKAMLNTLKLAKVLFTDKYLGKATIWLLVSCFGAIALRGTVGQKLIFLKMRREHITIMDAGTLPIFLAGNAFMGKFMDKGKIIQRCSLFTAAWLIVLYVDYANIMSFDPENSYSYGIMLYIISLLGQAFLPFQTYQFGFLNTITYPKYASSFSVTMFALINLGKFVPGTIAVTVLDFLPYSYLFIIINSLNLAVLYFLLPWAEQIDNTEIAQYHEGVKSIDPDQSPDEDDAVFDSGLQTKLNSSD